MEDFSKQIIDLIKRIPAGKVSTYGHLAAMAGAPRAARQVSRLLHSSSRKHNLPWHRVINAGGGISLQGEAGQIQRGLLESEGILFTSGGKVPLKSYLWRGEPLPLD